MFSPRLHPLLRACVLALSASSVVLAQTPTPRAAQKTPSLKGTLFASAQTPGTQSPTTTQTPAPQTPATQDATRPPGTEQRQSVPPQARPVPSDPTAPPGTQQRPDPAAPPGTGITQPTTTTITPQSPAVPTTINDPLSQTPEPTTTTGTRQDIVDPSIPPVERRPVPPLPSLVRLGVRSGESQPITLNEAIRRALENNNEIELARQDVRLTESGLRALEGVYDVIFSVTPQYSSFVSPQESSLGGSDESGTVSQTDFQVNPSIRKLSPVGGGQYNVFFNNNRRTTSSTFNTLNPVYSASFGVQFTQPLWRDRSIDRTRHDIRVQKKFIEQTDADFRRSTIEVIARVQAAYWDLVFALRDEQNQIANLNLARENFRRTEAGVAAGASAPLARAEVQTEVSNREAALLLANQSVTVAENRLKALLLRDALAPEWSVALVPTDQPTFDTTPINLQDAINEARANRPELRRLRLQGEISDIDIQFYKNQTKPDISIVSTVSTTGLAGSPALTANGLNDVTGLQVPIIFGDPNSDADAFLLSQINILRASQGLPPTPVPTVEAQTLSIPSNLVGGYGRMLRNLFSLDTRNVVVGVRISLPFRNRTAEANLATARIQQERLAATTRLQEQVVEVEVRNAAQVAETSRRRVLSARIARENAEVQLAGERRLFQVGRSTTFLLFQRENQLVNLRNQELRAETDYNKALAELQRATSTTLRANNVIIDSPVGQ
ncbi:MAG TPA: TolC family protein [Pyrinomonadaceae bacterium]|jgi:HAE1 family hydrophobic/amphiphilic exporter-1